jgi:hypothetical protein
MLILDILNNLNLLISILNHVDILNRHSRHSRIIGDRQNSGDAGQRSSANSPKKRGPLDSGFRFQATAGLDLIHFLRHDTYDIQEELLGIQGKNNGILYIIINPDWEFMGIHCLAGLAIGVSILSFRIQY